MEEFEREESKDMQAAASSGRPVSIEFDPDNDYYEFHLRTTGKKKFVWGPHSTMLYEVMEPIGIHNGTRSVVMDIDLFELMIVELRELREKWARTNEPTQTAFGVVEA